MQAPTQEEIRLRAYELWQRDGSPSGSGDEYWIRAEQELCGGMPTDTGAEPEEVDPVATESDSDIDPPKKAKRSPRQ